MWIDGDDPDAGAAEPGVHFSPTRAAVGTLKYAEIVGSRLDDGWQARIHG